MAFEDDRVSVMCAQFQSKPEDDAEGTEFIKGSKMKWVRWIDADNYAPDNPFRDTQRVMARFYMNRDQEKAAMEEGAIGADRYFATVRDRLEKLFSQGIYDVGGPNEPHAFTVSQAQRHEAFWCRLIELYVQHGGTPHSWDYGNGWPGLKRFGDLVTVENYATSLDLTRQAGGTVNLHEYNAPCVINPDGNNDGSRTLRVIHFLDELSDHIDVAGLPITIGECGITRAVMPGGDDLGYLSFNQWAYPPRYGLPYSIMTDEMYWRMMSELDDAYCAIPNIEVAFPFVTNPFGKWRTFDWHGWFLRQSAEKHATLPPIKPEPADLALVHQFIDRIPMSRKQALLHGLVFVDEVQVDARHFVGVCLDPKALKYVALPIELVGSTWVTRDPIVLDRPIL